MKTISSGSWTWIWAARKVDDSHHNRTLFSSSDTIPVPRAPKLRAHVVTSVGATVLHRVYKAKSQLPQCRLRRCQPTLTYSRFKNRKSASFHTLLLSNFKYFLTLFSKFFSSFPHGTCALSVSRKYLALDEIYHPL